MDGIQIEDKGETKLDPRRARTFGFFLLLGSAIGSLALGELAVRLFLPPPSFVPLPQGVLPGMIVADATLGYRYASGFSGSIETPTFRMHLVTNEIGLRDDSLEALKGADYRILAVGDSFTFGFGVEAQEAWPDRLEKALQGACPEETISVINGGVSGYGMRQMRILAEELLEATRPNLVVAGVFQNGFERVNDPFALFHGYLLKSSEIPRTRIVENGFLYSPWSNTFAREADYFCLRHFRLAAQTTRLLYRFVNKIRPSVGDEDSASSGTANRARELEPLLLELGMFRDQLRSRGIDLLVFLITAQRPDKTFSEEALRRNEAIRDFCRENHIDVYDSTPDLVAGNSENEPLWNGRDYHWSPLAHRLAASGLAEYVSRTRLKAHDEPSARDRRELVDLSGSGGRSKH